LCSRSARSPDDVLFINAAEHFEKGKRQNVLLPEHIDKIVETYQRRREEARYSKRVSLDDIAANDYNLNNSRYISTAVQEPEIDLAATHRDLVKIEKAIRQSTTKHNEFLKELKLPLLLPN
jgi:type I restriction enzyme M protein